MGLWVQGYGIIMGLWELYIYIYYIIIIITIIIIIEIIEL